MWREGLAETYRFLLGGSLDMALMRMRGTTGRGVVGSCWVRGGQMVPSNRLHRLDSQQGRVVAVVDDDEMSL